MNMNEQYDMTVMEHLTELRKRIIWILIVFFCALAVGLYFSGPVIQYIQEYPITDQIDLNNLNSFSPSDSLRVYMQFAFLIGVVITMPFALYQLWRFVAPGLKPGERKAALGFIPSAIVLFLAGIAFGYFVLFPMIVGFMVSISDQIGAQPMYGLAEFFSFLFNIVIPFGFLFQLPIVVMFLTRIRLVNPKRLAKMRRVAYFVLAVVAITLTPPEIVSDLMVTIPLFLLYELSVWLSGVVYRKQLREEQEEREKKEENEIVS
jgi:sec-independent protein translocase protein TatC